MRASTRSNCRHRIRRTRFQRFSQVLACTLLATLLGWAAPALIFDTANPISSDSVPTADPIGAADGNVSTQTGAFEYTYPIAVPPGRGATTPSLSLHYSSQGALYGTMAAGWTLQLPEIRFDPNSSVRQWQQNGPGNSWRPGRVGWISSLSGNHPLTSTSEPNGPNVEATYRAKVDADYIRYERLTAASGAVWRARTLEGLTYTFAEAANLDGINPEYFGVYPLTSVTDLHGNVATYHWKKEERSGFAVGFILDEINYGMNPDAGIPLTQPVAKINFDYGLAPDECSGTSLPIGAQLDMRGGVRHEVGRRRLHRITTHARDNENTSTLRKIREIDFGYDSNGLDCTAQHSPIRMLTSIRETGFSIDDSAKTLPATTFEYGDLARTFESPPSHWVPPLASGTATGIKSTVGTDYWTHLGSTLIDFDGDGLTDLLVADEENGSCGANFLKNVGNGLQPMGFVPFPTLDWSNGTLPTSNQGCSLTAQFTRFTNATQAPHCTSVGSYLVYKFADIEGDGLPDLIVALHHEVHLDPDKAGIPFENQTCLAAEEENCPDTAVWDCLERAFSLCTPRTHGWDCPNSPQANWEVCAGAPYAESQACGLTLWADSAGADGQTEECTCENDPTCDPAQEGCGQETPSECQDKCGCTTVTGSSEDSDLECLFHSEVTPPGGGWVPPVQDFGNVDAAQNDFCTRHPQRLETCEKYPWVIYKNTGGTFDLQNPHYTKSPIPLESNAGDTQFARTTRGFFGSGHGLIDINGDGYLDAVKADQTAANNPNMNTSAYDVFLGDGTGDFHADPVSGHAYAFFTPLNVALSYSWGIAGFGNPPQAAPFSFKNGIFGSLQDMNGDGLVDLLWVTPNTTAGQSEGVYTYLNIANAFEEHGTANASSWKISDAVPFALRTSVDVAAAFKIGTGSNQQWVATEAEANQDFRLLDVDGDGRLDFFGLGRANRSVLLGRGDGSFARTSGQSELVLDGGSGRLKADDLVRTVLLTGSRPHQWAVLRDFVDITGDGLPEVIDRTSGTGGQVITDADYGDHPHRLLKRVDNGRGLVTEVGYDQHNNPGHVSTDPPAVDNTNGDSVPNSFFVVRYVSRTNGMCDQRNPIGDECNLGPQDSPETTTQYRYRDMVYNNADGRYKFRGFKEAFAISPADGAGNRATVHSQYDYRVDATGRLSDETLFHDDAWTLGTSTTPVRTHKHLTTAVKTSFSSVKSYLLSRIETWECEESQDLAACQALPRRRQNFTYQPQGDGVFATTAVTDTYHNGPTTEGNKSISYKYTYDETGHILRRTLETQKSVDGGVLVEVAKMQNVWSSDLITLDAVKDYEDATTTHETQFVYDGFGNVIETRRPNQTVTGGDSLPIKYTYDSYGVWVETTENELGHTTTTEVDYGTGATLKTTGPNDVSGSGDFEYSRTEVDGFGRTTSSYVFAENGAGGYAEHQAGEVTYTDGIPSTTKTKKLVEFGGNDWVTSETIVDGLNRVSKVRDLVSGTTWAEQLYDYDDKGRLVKYTAPHPNSDTGNEVIEYRFEYDAVDRLVKTLLPQDDGFGGGDSNTVTDGAYIEVEYDRFTTTTREYIASNTSALAEDDDWVAEKKKTVDFLGRLVKVEERVDASTFGVTTYEYDGNDNIRRIVDPAGNETLLTHDWMGRRTQIELENSRIWTYGYDGNGNMVTRVAPYPSGATPGDYSINTEYDALDRPTSRTVHRHDLTTQEASDYAVGKTSFYYDNEAQVATCASPQSIGRLCMVTLSGGLGSITYQYDARGLLANEDRVLTVPNSEINGGAPFSILRATSATYNALGQPATVTLPDDPSAPSSAKIAVAYDSRGLPQSAKEVSTGSNVDLAWVRRNLTGRITLRVVDETGSKADSPTSSWSYDAFGRVTYHEITVPDGGGGSTPAASQTLSYSALGDVGKLDLEVDGINRNFTFKYDARHQLTRAEDDLSNYVGTWTYDDAGRRGQATYSRSSIPSRQQQYIYDPNAAQGVLDFLRALPSGSGRVADFEYDHRGNMTQRQVHHDWSDPNDDKTYDFKYDGQDRQVFADTPSGKETYFYDHDGNRLLAVQQDSGGSLQKIKMWFARVETHFEPDVPNHTWQVDKTIARVSLGQPVARIERDSTGSRTVEQVYHSTLEHLIVSLDDRNQVTSGFIYSPFGNILDSTGSEIAEHERRFNGKDFDSFTELSYYGARYYDQLSLVWTQGDPLYRFAPDAAWDEPRRGLLYAFSINNPLVYVDPDGRVPIPEAQAGMVTRAEGYAAAAASKRCERTACRVVEGLAAAPFVAVGAVLSSVVSAEVAGGALAIKLLSASSHNGNSNADRPLSPDEFLEASSGRGGAPAVGGVSGNRGGGRARSSSGSVGNLEEQMNANISSVSGFDRIVWKGFSKGSLRSHFAKHGREFGEISQNEYLQRAKHFAQEKGAGFLQADVGNFRIKFDPQTRRVLIGHAKTREIRTFYRADGRQQGAFEAAKDKARALSDD